MDIHCGGQSLVNIERAHGTSGTTGTARITINAMLCGLISIRSSALTAAAAAAAIAAACTDTGTGTTAAVATGAA